jgi:hypothetical protein
MFDQLSATAIQDRVSDALYRWRGIADWPEAEATVSDYVWTPDAEIRGIGNYQVSFSYRTGDVIQAGMLGINGVEEAPPYLRGATFTLRYNPKRPSRYYYANERSNLERAMLIASAIAVGAVGAFIMISLFPT